LQRLLQITMLVKKEIVSSTYKILETKLITRIWASDGWCYIPEFAERQKFTASSTDLFTLEREKWNGIIPSFEYEEPVEYHLITRKPLVWAEKTEWSHEKFSESIAIRSKNNQCLSH